MKYAVSCLGSDHIPNKLSLCLALLPFALYKQVAPPSRPLPTWGPPCIQLSLIFPGGVAPVGGGLTHDHVVAGVTEGGLLKDMLLKGVDLAVAAGVQASLGGHGCWASGVEYWAGAWASLGQQVCLRFRVTVGSREEVVSTFAPQALGLERK